jgi:hypothetical protein
LRPERVILLLLQAWSCEVGARGHPSQMRSHGKQPSAADDVLGLCMTAMLCKSLMCCCLCRRSQVPSGPNPATSSTAQPAGALPSGRLQCLLLAGLYVCSVPTLHSLRCNATPS